MLTTVYFATDRALEGPATDWTSYTSQIAAPSDPTAITYATAFVDNTDLTADKTGAIEKIENVSSGRFSQSAMDDLSNPGRNLLVFIHGFDNSFEAAITRAAFNREWFAASGVAAADTTVVAFSWPSLGKLISFPLPWEDYQKDQIMAGQSGLHLMSFFANLQPLLTRARANGNRVFLLSHSMGNYALQAGVQSWFTHGNGDAALAPKGNLRVFIAGNASLTLTSKPKSVSRTVLGGVEIHELIFAGDGFAPLRQPPVRQSFQSRPQVFNRQFGHRNPPRDSRARPHRRCRRWSAGWNKAGMHQHEIRRW